MYNVYYYFNGKRKVYGMKKKFVGKSLAIVLALFVIATSVITAFADTDHQYSIDELKLSVKLPTYMDVVTRNLSTNDEVYKRHSKSVLNFQEYGIYLQAFSQDGKQILTITMDQDENSKTVDNYNTLDDSQLASIKEKFSQAENCQSCSMDTYNDIIYFDSIINTPSDGSTLYVTKADTLVNGMYIHYTLQSNDGEIDEADKEFMTTVLKNVRYELESKSIFDRDIMTFIWIIGTVLVVIIISIIIYNIIRKKKRQSRLDIIDDRMYRNDRKDRQQAENARKNRNTATGAERPDAFFDGVDGIASSEDIDEIEKALINEAHQQVSEYADKYSTQDAYDETEEYGKEKAEYSEFLGEDRNSVRERRKKRVSDRKNSRRGRKF